MVNQKINIDQNYKNLRFYYCCLVSAKSTILIAVLRSERVRPWIRMFWFLRYIPCCTDWWMLAEFENLSVHMLKEAWPHQDLIQVSFITLRGYYGSYLVKDEEDGRWRLSLLISRYSFWCCFFCCPAWWFFQCWCGITLTRTPQRNVNQWEILDSEARSLGGRT